MLEEDESVTMPEPPCARGARRRIPVLLLLGSALEVGGRDRAALTRIGARLEIGRHADPGDLAAGVALKLEDRLLSRLHARIVPNGAEWMLDDAGSKNGTYLDGRRVLERTRLADGALLFFGHHAAVFRELRETELEAIEEDLARPVGPVATASPQMALACRSLRRLAQAGQEVLLTGETGVGKEVYARALHREAGRTGRFVAINCAAIPRELAESELFGYARGAHSLATHAKPGLLAAAEGGTVFLDEIGDMGPELQAKLLRFLQDRELMPLGATTPRRIDVRVVAATSQSGLGAGEGGLRSDLSARLGSQPVRLPPLRERIEDLGVLIAHFLTPVRPKPFELAAFHALCLYTWPRNIRELEKMMGEARAYCGQDEKITLEHLPDHVAQGMERVDPEQERPRAKRPTPTRDDIEALLRVHQGNVAAVARALDRQWAVVWRWITRYGIDPDAFRGE